MDYVGKALAAAAIRAYQRRLSGRGPLRRVACGFAGTESCSHYGLRAVEELASSLPAALRAIHARLSDCRDLSLYRFGAGGLGWGRGHEAEPAALAAALAERGERPTSIDHALAAREAVARWRGEAAEAAAARRLRGGRATPPLRVRPGDAAIRRLRRRGAAAAAAVAVVAVALPWTPALAAVAAAVAGIAAALSAAAARGAARRLERQRVAAAFRRPAVPVTREAARLHDAA